MEAWTATRPVREVEAALLGDRLPRGPCARPDRGRDRPGAAQPRAARPSCAIPTRRPTGRAGSSARRCRSRSTGRVELPPAELLGASTDAVLRELAGCDDDRARAAARRRGDRVSTPTPLLDGMRVLDAGIWRPVPHATQLLADLGADVLKLEPPGGDPMRTFPDIFRDVASHKRSVVRRPAHRRRPGARARARGRRRRVLRRLAAGRRRPARRRLRRDCGREPVDHLLLGERATGRPGRSSTLPGHDVNYQALAGAVARAIRRRRPRRSPTCRSPTSPRRTVAALLDLRGVGEPAADRRRGAHRRRDGRRGRVVGRAVVGQRDRAAAPNRRAARPATACSRCADGGFVSSA